MKIAIAGYGVEGKANVAYFSRIYPDAQLTIVDENEALDSAPVGVPTVFGPNAFGLLDGFDMVVRTAGLDPKKIKTDGRVWSATNEFFAKCPAPIIGVTGTKGKGTTSSYIASILRAHKKRVHLVGNIGTPALEVLSGVKPDDIVVYELSSFQLWDCERSPETAVVLMIEPDHLDVHASMEEYLAAKSNIRRHQNPHQICWYAPGNQYSEWIAHSNTEGVAKPFGVSGVPDSVYVSGGSFWRNDDELCTTDAVVLPGEHNITNACAALSAALPYLDGDFSKVEAGLRSFSGLAHRLKYVAEKHGVRYYDDSIATTPGSAIAALQAFDQPKTIILGGSDKGADYTEVVETCRAVNAHVVAVGKTGERIAELCEENGVTCTRLKANDDMRRIVSVCRDITPAGGVVILSPASASFDQYKNYSDRGDQFIMAVEQL